MCVRFHATWWSKFTFERERKITGAFLRRSQIDVLEIAGRVEIRIEVGDRTQRRADAVHVKHGILLIETGEPDKLRLFDGFRQLIQRDYRTDLILLQTFDDLHSRFENFLASFVYLICLDYRVQRGLSCFQHADLLIEVCDLTVEVRVPPIAAQCESSKDENKKNGRDASRQVDFHAGFGRFLSSGSKQIDLNH